MAQQTQISLIQNYIKNKTEEILKNSAVIETGIEASDISYDFKIDRANTSRIVNKLWKEGNLVKIAGRPVLFLDYRALCKKFPGTYIPTYIGVEDNINKYINGYNAPSIIDEIKSLDINDYIGAKGSLAEQVEKAKSAVCYPPYGLHTLIYGNIGTGKTDLVIGMINYAIKTGVKDKQCPHYNLDCRNYYKDNGQLEEVLFGSYDNLDIKKSRKGLVQKAKGGFIVLEHIEFLSETFIELLGPLISKNIYSNKKTSEVIPVECMLILTTTLPLDDHKIKSLVSYIPNTIKLTDIDERGSYEKIQLILDVFSKEAKRIGLPIKISKDVLLCFATKKYPQNITQLENEVKRVSSKAYMSSLASYTKQININLYNLPSSYLEVNNETITASLRDGINNLLRIIPEDQIIFDFNGHSSSFDIFQEFPHKSASHLLNQFVDEFNVDIDSLANIDSYVNENINCLKNCGDIQLNALKNNIDPYVFNLVLNVVSQIPRYSNLKNHVELLYGILLHITNAIRRLKNTTVTSDSTLPLTDKLYPEEYSLARKIFNDLSEKYNFQIPSKEIDFLTSYLAITNQYVNKKCVGILVIAHGQSTASDMVRYINKIVKNEHYIDAIDFNDKMQLNDCIELACLKSSSLNQGSGVLIVCDMEPLTTIYEAIIKNCGIPCKTVFPLSLTNLIQLVERSSSSSNDLDSLAVQKDFNKNYQFLDDDDDVFIRNITERVIKKTSIFIDCDKAVTVLKVCLNHILETLNISFSNDLAVKFYCHCVSVLERTIKNETWQNSKVKRYLSKNGELMQTIEQCFEYANNTYGIKIPQTELVYIAEIFEPYKGQ